MKTIYSIISLLISFFCMTMQAQTRTITSSETISITTEYVDNANMEWIVNKIEPNKPLLINYSINTEYNYDFVRIYTVDTNGAETLIVSLSGVQSGSISSVLPTGNIKITFTSDVGANYLSNPALYGGFKLAFSPDNTYPTSTYANQYTPGNLIVNGNLGLGVLNPSYKLDVNGSVRLSGNVECENSIAFQFPNRFWVTSANVPTMRDSAPKFPMPQYGIAAPLSQGSADLWLSGNSGIRMFTAGNPNPVVNILHNGNVGIGTIAPQAKLDVVNSISGFNKVISIRSTSGKNSGDMVGIGFNSECCGSWSKGGIFYERTGGFGIGKLHFMLNPNTNQSDLSSSNTKMTIDNNGNVGIGTTTPTRALEVFGDNKTPKIALTFSGASQAGVNYIQSVTELHYMEFGTFGTEHPFTMFGLKLGGSTVVNMFPKTTGYGLIGTSTAAPLVIGTNNLERMRVNVNGFVGIGTTNPQNMLDVKGTIRAMEIKVESVDKFADFVFDPDYQLPTLSQVNSYIKANKHLQNIPSAAEVKENGMSLVDMQVKLLQKVEELTLYIIQQQKEIDLLKQSKR